MDQPTRDYLIRGHAKIIAHYQKVLEASSLEQSERERIQQRLVGIEAELHAIKTDHASDAMRLAHAA